MQGERDEGCEGVGEVLVGLGQTAVSAEPGKGPFGGTCVVCAEDTRVVGHLMRSLALGPERPEVAPPIIPQRHRFKGAKEGLGVLPKQGTKAPKNVATRGKRIFPAP